MARSGDAGVALLHLFQKREEGKGWREEREGRGRRKREGKRREEKGKREEKRRKGRGHNTANNSGCMHVKLWLKPY